MGAMTVVQGRERVQHDIREGAGGGWVVVRGSRRDGVKRADKGTRRKTREVVKVARGCDEEVNKAMSESGKQRP